MKNDIVVQLVSFIIASFSFAFGATKFFRKRKPLYLQLLLCAAGCFALQQLSGVVNSWCGVNETVSIGMLGIFGCNFFLLSANFGTLDRIVDDGGAQNRPAKRIALAAPLLIAGMIIFAFLSWKDRDLFCACMWVAMLLPALPASYYNLKHILMPLDPFAFLRATKLCNFMALLFYLLIGAYAAVKPGGGWLFSGMLSVAVSLSVSGLVMSAVRGAKQWGI